MAPPILLYFSCFLAFLIVCFCFVCGEVEWGQFTCHWCFPLRSTEGREGRDGSFGEKGEGLRQD